MTESNVHVIGVDRSWWRQIQRGTTDFEHNNIKVVREDGGWVRVILFYATPLLLNCSRVKVSLEDEDCSLRKGGLKFDCWQLQKFRSPPKSGFVDSHSHGTGICCLFHEKQSIKNKKHCQ